eukprot:jgi/Bigna1/75240/fgenesh1_pg.33_\
MTLSNAQAMASFAASSEDDDEDMMGFDLQTNNFIVSLCQSSRVDLSFVIHFRRGHWFGRGKNDFLDLDRKSLALCGVGMICMLLVGIKVGMIIAEPLPGDVVVEENGGKPAPWENPPAIVAGQKQTNPGESKSSPERESPSSSKEEQATNFSDLPSSAIVDVVTIFQRLRTAKTEISKHRLSLLKSYGNDEKILSTAGISNSRDSTVLVDKMKLAMLQGKENFVISVAGSSVSAGHDNLGSDAWPVVLGDTLRPLWTSVLGVNFTVRNQAVGGRNPNPHPVCLGPMLGEDADIVIREWQYWAFHEGFEPNTVLLPERSDHIQDQVSGVRDPVLQAAGLEVFIRMALMLKNRPAVHLLFLQHSERLHSKPLKYLSDWLNPEKKSKQPGIFSPYASTSAVNYFDAFGTTFDHLREKAKRPRWSKDLDENTGKKVASPDDGYDDVGACPVDFEKQDGYPKGLLFVNWHPGKLGHQVMGHQFAYYYMGLMLNAVESLLAVGKDGLLQARKALLTQSGRQNNAPLPSPIVCNPDICENKPSCAYSYLPKAHGPDVGDWILNKTTEGTAAEEMEEGEDGGEEGRATTPTVSSSSSSRFLDVWSNANIGGGWVNSVAPHQELCNAKSFFDSKCYAPRRKGTEDCVRCMQHLSHLDQKRAFRGWRGAGELSVKLAFKGSSSKCSVWVCEPPYEWSKPDTVANFATDLKFAVNDKPCTQSNKCYRVEQVGYKQCGVLDVRSLDNKCAGKTARLSIKVAPAPPFYKQRLCSIYLRLPSLEIVIIEFA